MDVEEFESYLTMDELANFKKILKGSYRMHVESEKADGVISRAFLWANTEQGNNYWYEIQQRLRKAEPLIPLHMKGHEYMRFFTASQWGELCSYAMSHLGSENYGPYMNARYATIGSFISQGVPTQYQSKFIINVRIADSSIYRATRGYQVTPGEFLTKVELDRDMYQSTTHIHAGL